jgi:hypothetical protein
MIGSDRREFLGEVGGGMLAALVGPALAGELGLGGEARAEEKDKPIKPALDRLAGVLQQTPPDKLFGVLKGLLDKGTDLRDLVAAGAVANTRAFAGQDYDGYHTFMALPPSYAMAKEQPEGQRALPVVKVLYRNARLISSHKCHDKDEMASTDATKEKPTVAKLIEASRGHKKAEADRMAIALGGDKPEETFDAVQPLIHDALDVHRVVLTWRCWEVLDLTGKDHARMMLRHTVRHCAGFDYRWQGNWPNFRDTLPKVLENHKLLKRKAGTRKADDAQVEKLAKVIYGSKREEAAEAVAAALGEGFSLDSIGEAMSLASTRLLLADKGLPRAQPGKPVGSVHGASVGVHASDSSNAWQHIAAVVGSRNAFASLIAGAYHTAGQTGNQMPKPWPLPEDVEKVTEKDAAKLLAALEEAIRGRDQRRACAVTHRYGELNHSAKGLLALLRKYAVSEDGALHAEKYYRTASEEFGRGRPAFRWQHLTALARVTASAHGFKAPGVEEARKVLGAS